jgi:hypothetical protein
MSLSELDLPAQRDLLSSLIGGVVTSVPEGGSERDVVTFVSKPLWNIWCEMTEMPPGTKPSDWIKDGCARIYESETILVDSDRFFAVSFAQPLPF